MPTFIPRNIPGLWLVAAALAAALLPQAGRADSDLLKSKPFFYAPRLGETVPTDLTFRDEGGKQVRLGDYGRTRPLVLVLAYYRCPMLCNLVLNDLFTGLRGARLTPGKDYEVVVVSFDPREKPELARAKKTSYVEEFSIAGAEAGWHFLTGEQPQIDRLSEAVGFRAVWDEEQKQFAHGRGILILTGGWKISRYVLDGAYPPRDLRLGLIEASEGHVGSPVDRVLLMCFNYNPSTGKYSMAVLTVVRAAGAASVALLLAFWLVSWRHARRAAAGAPHAAAAVTEGR
jgi:protein SCO1/2